ncbi:isoprenylcysteine carboxylmethyltransferase family protein [Mobilitalea sibirica]|uniref:Isoprenylcysteine carboxylmethyltransferase family protein n=1 Tax=Mobilitalea sibirica TaxID=1462919 RepID=A0A8J7H3M5_9FIRM|nr:isoprenylcysteine carboxylmethyltransferase family protein [Mobilitalea sibirica]MBH1941773.1 isoprenylcysteine carboxylmethyltransferase family protein [Mobilitalea sibirica]
MRETLESHFHNWFGVVFFIVVYSVVLFFIPFYKKMDKKPVGTYIAFVLAFAIEMHGIPFSMYVISWIIGKNLPNGVLWGHTLFDSVGYLGMYINYTCAIIALILILNGWYNIYKKYWSKKEGEGILVTTGIYRYIRHPQYTGLMLLSFGMLAEWVTIPLLILFPVIIILYVRLAKREERDMVDQFGADYEAYRKRTKMFIPFIV